MNQADTLDADLHPDKVDAVKDALANVGVSGVTGRGARAREAERHTAIYRGREYEVTLLPKMKIECVVPDHVVQPAVQAIIESARTGQIGDGRVFVLAVIASYKIRTGEQE